MTELSCVLRRACLLFSVFGTLLALFAAAVPTLADSAAAPSPVVRYANVLRSFNPQLSLAQSTDIATHVLLLSSYYSLDPRLLVAIVGVESHWHAGAVSQAGAQGLGQLMPATASSLGVLAFDVYENLDGTARYLRRMLQQYAGLSPEARDVRAIASYNAGPAAVARADGIPPIAETRAYVAQVMDLWHRLQAQLPGDAPIPTPRPHVTTRSAAVAHVAPHPTAAADAPVLRVAPNDSVADFTLLDLHSMEAFVLAQPDPTPQPSEPRGLRRWFLRAFGPRH